MTTTPKQWVYDAIVTKDHDGDTADFTVALIRALAVKEPVDLGFDCWVEPLPWMQTAKQKTAPTYSTAHISGRFLGENADELATPTGKEALAYLETIMPVGTKVRLQSFKPIVPIGSDKFGGRWDVVIVLSDGTNVNQKMLDTGHAAPWNGQGPKPTT